MASGSRVNSCKSLVGVQCAQNRAGSMPLPSPSLMLARHRHKHIRSDEEMSAFAERQRFQETMDDPQTRQRTEDLVQSHLNKTFAPLNFPPELAMRVITHASFRGGQYGHNTRLSFVGELFCESLARFAAARATTLVVPTPPDRVSNLSATLDLTSRLHANVSRIGRRVMHAYLRLFVLSACAPSPDSTATEALRSPFSLPFDDMDEWCDQFLHTYRLGEHVGGVWRIEDVMKWTPAIVQPTFEPSALLRSSGLFKVRGATVEAIIGGIYHQYGGAIALRAFHTRVLPHLGVFLKDPLREHAERRCEEMGGPKGWLIAAGEDAPSVDLGGLDAHATSDGRPRRSTYQPPPLRENSAGRVDQREIREKIRAVLG